MDLQFCAHGLSSSDYLQVQAIHPGYPRTFDTVLRTEQVIAYHYTVPCYTGFYIKLFVARTM